MVDSASPDDHIRLTKLVSPATTIRRAELLDLYKQALDEYRFEVTLNWNRAQYYLALNIATVAAATGVMRVGGSVNPVAAVVFVLGFASSRFARKAIARGHEYYRHAVYKKTLIEHLLGRLQPIEDYSYPGANLAIATTRGMLEAETFLDDPKPWIGRASEKGTVTHAMTRLLDGFAIANGFGAVFCVAMAAIEFWPM